MILAVDFEGACIYAIKNIISNNLYIGSTNNYKNRIKIHFRDLKNNKHHSIALQRAYNKYGIDKFQILILESIKNIKNLIKREQYYIDTRKPKYNMAPNAGSNLGFKQSLKTKKLLSKIVRNLWKKDYFKNRKGTEHYGKNHFNFGKHWSKKSKDKMSKSHIKLYKHGYIHPCKGIKFSRQRIEKMREISKRPILQFTKSNILIRRWEGIIDAAKYFNITPTPIIKCLRKHKNRHYCQGFIWKYDNKGG